MCFSCYPFSSLGKTIQTLTRIVDNPATKADKDDGWSASTLWVKHRLLLVWYLQLRTMVIRVVCPLALVGQWADEIKKMTKLTVLKHQGTSRTNDPIVLRRHNIVVTTYDTVKSEYAAFVPEAKNESKSKERQNQEDSDSDEAEDFGRNVRKSAASGSKKKAKNALFHVKWFRIVLGRCYRCSGARGSSDRSCFRSDEAHNIKNHTTKGAIACCELQGRFKWCLTGTPL